MADVHEISKMLGSIQADVVHIRRNTELTDAKMDKMNENVIRHDASIKSAHNRIDELKPVVDDYTSIKQKGIGALTLLGAVCGFIGAAMGKVITLFFS